MINEPNKSGNKLSPIAITCIVLLIAGIVAFAVSGMNAVSDMGDKEAQGVDPAGFRP